MKNKQIEILVPALLQSWHNNENAAKDICIRCERTRRLIYITKWLFHRKNYFTEKKSIELYSSARSLCGVYS